MPDKKRYKHKKSGKIVFLGDLAYSLVQDSYDPFPEGEVTVSTTKTTTAKKNAGAGVESEEAELEKVRKIWSSLFNEDPNPRKALKTLQKEIDEFNEEK